jgi:mannose-6-phosphate isomerase
MFKLQGVVQNYDWGHVGYDSLVFKIYNSNNKFNDIKMSYAEYWLGTHPKGDAYIPEMDMSLSSYIEANPHVLGSLTNNGKLPFLFKVLSIKKPLSLQAHPDKELAEILHNRYPKIYKDDNHKPEMMIALGNFELLYGFRPLDEIVKNIENIPEFGKLVSEDVLEFMRNIDPNNIERGLCDFMFYYMNNDKLFVNECVSEYINRLRYYKNLNELEELTIRLNKYHTNDIGVFAPYIFNYMKLHRNEVIYIGANKLHSYISGDCIECMACSDNVVRGGLTKKYIDIDNLINMLSYDTDKPEILKPIVKSNVNYTTLSYVPPVSEFMVTHFLIGKNIFYNLEICDSSIILYIEQGSGYMLCNGKYEEVKQFQSYFIESMQNVKIITNNDLLSIYYAKCNNNL